MLLFILAYYIYIVYRSMECMHMLQQNLYNENNRYFKWIGNNLSKVFNLMDLAPILFFVFFYFIEDRDIMDFTYVSASVCFLMGVYFEYKRIKDNQNKLPLKATPRIKRLFLTSFIVYSLPIIFLITSNNPTTKVSLIILSTLFVFFEYFVIYIALIINTPIDLLENLYYLLKARVKLSNYNNLIRIGITGSYGKTTSKNIINDILSYKYITRISPLNYNTKKGLMITVNNYLDKFDQVFIAEMGAYARGDIEECAKFVRPKYGILTTIGEAHLETFKTRENIQKTKFELIENLKEDGLAILNLDDPYQVSYKLKNKVQVKWIAIDNDNADLSAYNIKISDKGMTFKVKYKEDTYDFRTMLLGRHNIYNILGGILLGLELGVDIEDIKHAVLNLKPVEHRLELKKIANFYQLDDCYNSNPVGANSALDVLNLMDGLKVVVTPGMIELGPKEYEENMKFGEHMAKVADYVVLIGEERTKAIYKGLLDNGFNKDNIFILNNVAKSFEIVASIAREKKTYALYENDLPDIYTEKGTK